MTRTNVLRSVAALIVVLTLLLVLLTACGDTVRSGNKTIGDCGAENASSNCVTTVMYKGKPLHCVTWGGGHGETGLSCDFVEYHENPGGQF